MFRLMSLIICLHGMIGVALAQSAAKPDTRSFELTPVAPPKPALKYQLLFHDAADRLNGNAAILYLDAILMMGPEAKESGAKALEAYKSKDLETFNALSQKL
jgi:hypothetical protein